MKHAARVLIVLEYIILVVKSNALSRFFERLSNVGMFYAYIVIFFVVLPINIFICTLAFPEV